MQRLLIALLALIFPSLAWGDTIVHNLGTNATSPLPASSCLYVDQSSTTDAKLCSGWATALGALTAASNLSDLTNATTAINNLFGTPTQNKVLASPNGSTGNMSARALVGADLPVPSASTLGGTESITCAAGQHVNTISTAGVPGCTVDTGGTPVTFVGAMSGTNTITATSTTPGGFTLTDQFIFCGSAGGTNTGATTLNVNSTGATAVNKQTQAGLLALSGGEITNGNEYCFQFQSSSSKFILQTIPSSSVSQAATSATVSAAQWANWQVFDIQAAGQTLTLPVVTSLATNGGIIVKTEGNSATLAPNAADGINGGTVGTSVTIPANYVTAITTSGASGTTAITAPLGLLQGSNITITQNANGTTTIASTGGGALTQVGSTQVASNSAALSFTNIGSNIYYKLMCKTIIPATTATNLNLQFSEDNGSTWKVSGYFNATEFAGSNTNGAYSAASSGDSGLFGTESGTSLLLSNNASNAQPGLSGFVELFDLPSTTAEKSISFNFGAFDGTHYHHITGSGIYTADTGAVTAIRVQMSSGNITSGSCTLYGYSS